MDADQSKVESQENELGAATDNILWFSLPFLAVQVLIYFATEFDVLLAKAYTSSADTALFGTSRRLILQMLAPVQVITASVGSTIAELYAKNDKENLEKTVRYSATLASLVTIPLLGLCILFPQFILGTIFGNFYRDGATVFVVLAIGQIVNTLTGQCGPLMMLSGRTTTMLIVRSVAAVAMIVSGSWAAINHGILGLAVATSVVLSLQNIAVWLLARIQIGLWTHPSLTLQKPRASKTLPSKGAN